MEVGVLSADPDNLPWFWNNMPQDRSFSESDFDSWSPLNEFGIVPSMFMVLTPLMSHRAVEPLKKHPICSTNIERHWRPAEPSSHSNIHLSRSVRLISMWPCIMRLLYWLLVVKWMFNILFNIDLLISSLYTFPEISLTIGSYLDMVLHVHWFRLSCHMVALNGTDISR